jgi:hypothetical protein
MTFHTQNGNNVYLPGTPVAPMFLVITAITNANPMQVTVSTPNAWIVGQLGYFSIPFDYGMFQLDGLTGEIVSVDSTNLIFKVAIDSNLFDRFTVPSSGEKPATMSSAGSRNTYNFSSLPFHSVGNAGN